MDVHSRRQLFSQSTPPPSISVAEERRTCLSQRIENIHSAFAEKKKKGPSGTPLSREEYFAWRAQLVAARDLVVQEIIYLNHWMKTERKLSAASLRSNHTPVINALHLLRRLKEGGWITPEEARILDDLQEYLDAQRTIQ